MTRKKKEKAEFQKRRRQMVMGEETQYRPVSVCVSH